MPVSGFCTIPSVGRLHLAGGRVPLGLLADSSVGWVSDGDLLADVDITLADGRISVLSPAGQRVLADAPVIQLERGLILPGFADLHTHLDKGHIWPRQENPDGSFMGALNAVIADRTAHWSAQDVRRRMEFSLACAYAHGTVAVRTHLDSIPPQHDISWAVFAELQAEWADRITLQAVSIQMLESLMGPFGDDLADLIARSGGVLGAVTFMAPDIDAQLDRCFRLAADRGLDLDFHVDESGNPADASLERIAEAKLRHRFAGTVTVGHCCSLAVQPDDQIDRVLDRVAAADLKLVSLPMCNLYLQDRQTGRTPRWRGVTLLHEMRARGIDVAVSSDNCRDPFYAYGDHDLIEVFTQAARIAHLDRPVGDWPKAITSTPAAIMGLSGVGQIAVGGPADLVLCRARSWSEFLSRPQADRVVLRRGRAIDTNPPDYRLLDDLFA